MLNRLKNAPAENWGVWPRSSRRTSRAGDHPGQPRIVVASRHRGDAHSGFGAQPSEHAVTSTPWPRRSASGLRGSQCRAIRLEIEPASSGLCSSPLPNGVQSHASSHSRTSLGLGSSSMCPATKTAVPTTRRTSPTLSIRVETPTCRGRQSAKNRMTSPGCARW